MQSLSYFSPFANEHQHFKSDFNRLNNRNKGCVVLLTAIGALVGLPLIITSAFTATAAFRFSVSYLSKQQSKTDEKTADVAGKAMGKKAADASHTKKTLSKEEQKVVYHFVLHLYQGIETSLLNERWKQLVNEEPAWNDAADEVKNAKRKELSSDQKYKPSFSKKNYEEVLQWLEQHMIKEQLEKIISIDTYMLSGKDTIKLNDKTVHLLEPILKKLPELVELRLSGHNLTKIPSFIFELEKVKKIDLSYNKIKKLKEEEIKRLNESKISEVDLRMNPLTRKDIEMCSLPKPQQITPKVKAEAVKALLEVRKTRLEANQETAINKKILEFIIDKIKGNTFNDDDISLFIDNNQEIKEELEKIEKINLNIITKKIVDKKSIELNDEMVNSVKVVLLKMKNLKEIEIHNEQITKIPDYFFELEQLEKLHLQHCGIKELTDEQLEKINQAENKIFKLVNLTYNPLKNDFMNKINANGHTDPKCKVLATHKKEEPHKKEQGKSYTGPRTAKITHDHKIEETHSGLGVLDNIELDGVM